MSGEPPGQKSALKNFFLRTYRRLEHLDPQVVTCLFCLLIVVALEVSNPPYFFGDDNMQFSFVQMSEIARNLVHGESIFRHHHIFGGDFDMRDDPAFLSLWNPLTLLCSLLTLTRWKFWAVDVVVSVCLLAGGGAMARLLMQLRSLKYLRLSNILVAFLSTSYACSGYSLVVCASWGNFAANLSALPMFLIGVLHPRVVAGTTWVIFATLLGLLAGHVDPLCYSILFVSLFVAVVAWKQRSFKPLAILTAGIVIAILIASPLLWRAWCGFQTNPRADGLKGDLGVSIPIQTLLAGYFMGWGAHWVASSVRVTFFQHPWATFLFSFSFSGSLVLVAFRNRKTQSLFSHLPLVLALFAVLLVARPLFLSHLIAHVPVFKSLSTPFRQLMFFHFYMVLWLAFNIGRVPMRDGAKLMSCGLFLFFFSLFRVGHPALSDYGDRTFILTGQAGRFYEELRRDMPKDSVLATVGEPSSWFFKYPVCLAGGNDFPALYGVTMAGGYSPTKPVNSEKTRIPCDPILGFFNPNAVPSLLRAYKKLYVIELAPHSSIRLGLVDSTCRFVTEPKTIDFTSAMGRDRPERRFIKPATSDLSEFTNSIFRDGSSFQSNQNSVTAR